jgi:hypothetical protein
MLLGAQHGGGVRVVNADIRTLARTAAFNGVADLSAVSSRDWVHLELFTPKDKQDIHVHGLPAVEFTAFWAAFSSGIADGPARRASLAMDVERGDWAIEP